MERLHLTLLWAARPGRIEEKVRDVKRRISVLPLNNLEFVIFVRDDASDRKGEILKRKRKFRRGPRQIPTFYWTRQKGRLLICCSEIELNLMINEHLSS
jgi:hypothetical protein